MLLAITGIQRVDMKSNDGEVHGNKVYGIVKDNQTKGVVGEPTASVWFDDAKNCKLPEGVTFGSLVEIFFDQGKKTPAFCREYDGE